MVTLKGTKDGLLITLGEGQWPEVLTDLAEQLDRPEASHFFDGVRARLVSGNRALNAEELKELAGLLEKHSMQLELNPPPPRPRPPRRAVEEAETETGDNAQDHESWT
ncbi:MAG: hypothetical protein ACM3JD_19445, partial [Rudaea sp.]